MDIVLTQDESTELLAQVYSSAGQRMCIFGIIR